MPLATLPLFDTIYDRDSGTWTAVVRVDNHNFAVVRKGYALETDAQESLAELKRMLAEPRDGNVEAVLRTWLKS